VVKKVKLLLVDDQILFVECLKNILEMRTADLKIIAIAHDGIEAVELVERKTPDIVLMDVRMPNMDGVEATRIIHGRYPKIKIIMLTTFGDEDYVHEALKYGAVGYLLKTIAPMELIWSIHAVKYDTIQIDPFVAKKMVEERQVEAQRTGPIWLKYLSSREREVLKLIAKGLTNRRIAERLFIAEQTVKNHLSVIYSKLDVHNRSEALLKVKEEKVQLGSDD